MKLLGVLVAMLFAGACADDESIHDVVTCHGDVVGDYACERICRDVYDRAFPISYDGKCIGRSETTGETTSMPFDYFEEQHRKGFCADTQVDGKPLFVFADCID